MSGGMQRDADIASAPDAAAPHAAAIHDVLGADLAELRPHSGGAAVLHQDVSGAGVLEDPRRGSSRP
jgi:hypothetical protein